MVADNKIYYAIKEFINGSCYEIVSEEDCDLYSRINVQSGKYKCPVDIFTTGTIRISGKLSPLKDRLTTAKLEIEAGNFSPAKSLPFEIERFPEIIRQEIPECDQVIVRFVEELVDALRSNLLLSTAFLIGAASEKAICLLVDSYASAIADVGHRTQFEQRIGRNKAISKKYEEFKASYGSCKSKCESLQGSDLFLILDSLFQFYRLTRNDVGHPQIIPNLNRDILIANIGQFIHYLRQVYSLINFFTNNEVIIS